MLKSNLQGRLAQFEPKAHQPLAEARVCLTKHISSLFDKFIKSGG